MREEFLEPLPVIQTKATMVFGRTRYLCYIVNVTVDEFRVAVPGAERYEGDPRVQLVTSDSIYPVRILRQEPHSGGYSYRLLRIVDVKAQNSNGNWGCRLKFSAFQTCAAGLIVVAITGFFNIPSARNQLPTFCLQGLRKEVLSWWSPSASENDRVPTGISIDAALVIDDIETHAPQKLPQTEISNDVQTVSISMISPASMSVSTSDPLIDDEPNDNRFIPNGKTSHPTKKRVISLLSLLEEGQVGRRRIASPSLAPWLFGSSHSNQFGLLRLSDAAASDLQQFEIGLRNLPKRSRLDAISGLQQTLKLANDISNAKRVRGTQDVFVISSDDANVYFRTLKSTIELVRILPIDFNGAE